jgi:hypothetical protein
LIVRDADCVDPEYVPEIVAVRVATTAVVVTVNVFVFVFAATVTLAGTVAAPSELVVETTAPVGGALPLSVSVPAEDAPPPTAVGLKVTDKSAAGVVEITTVLDTPASVAVIVEDSLAATPSVVTVKVAVFAFVATVTVAGTVAQVVSELVSATAKPVAPALPFKVIVPVTLLPPTTRVALSDTADNDAGCTVSVPL